MENNTQDNVPAGYWKDAKGRLVPEGMVRPVDKLEDQLVRKMMMHADELSKQIGRFKGHCFDDVGAFMALIAEQYGATKGGAKGNMTLTSYDGCLQVKLAVADNLTFGPELQVAKGLIDECIAEWADGARPEIRMLVDHAFRTDQEGKVNREAIFSLRRMEIDDDRWRQAMQAITDSIRIIGSKEYFRFYRRDTPQSAWQPITIDLAAA
ncbi:MAG: DUF3164 family protein [Nevskiaceae bacterium]|nr:MAG: DUF3164 family protein [Nevskiaceae bacterium]